MAHRTAEDQLHHIREARQYIDDDRLSQSERALTAIAAGDYKGVRSRESGDNAQPRADDRPRGLAPQDSADPRNQREPSPAMVQAGLRRSRIIPRVLTVPCPVGHADVGERCYVHGVCWQRVVLRAARP